METGSGEEAKFLSHMNFPVFLKTHLNLRLYPSSLLLADVPVSRLRGCLLRSGLLTEDSQAR
jgi:hypothetical protein